MSNKLVTADVHLSDNPRDSYRLRWFDKFIKLAERKRPSAVVVLGDLTEEKDRHSAALVNSVVDNLYALTQICTVIGLQGNHDYVADPDNGFWSFLSRIQNLRWITRPTTMDDCLFLPHTRNYKRDWQNIDLRRRWIFAHNTFEGADSGHGHRLEGIPVDIFPRGTRVISGDVHKPQEVGPVTYVGAPYLCDFGDDYIPRVLWVENDTITSLASPGPQKRVVDIQNEDDLQLQKHVKPGDIVKVRVSLSIKDRDHWPTLRKTVERWATDTGFVLHTCLPVFKTTIDRRELRNLAKRSDKDTLRKYGDARDLSDETVKTGMSLLDG